MRTDALLLFQGGSNDKKASNRMDHTQNRSKDTTGMGFGKEQVDGAQTRFKETYARIAQSNTGAKSAADSSVKARSEHAFQKGIHGKCDDKKLDNYKQSDADVRTCEKRDDRISDDQQVLAEIEMMFQYTSREITVNDSSQTETAAQNSEQASEVIIQALLEISNTLQLNIAPGLDKVSFDSINDETVEQFSEIVHALRSILEALEMSSSQNQPIDTGKMVIDGSEAGEMVRTIKLELFKVELGFNMLGVSEQVQNKLAEFSEKPFTSGIAQAIDPSQLSVPSDQMKKIFSEALNSSEGDSKISQLVQKMNELVQESNVGKVNVMSANTAAVVQKTDIGTFDAQTFRAMLKLEMKEKISAENAEAASKSEKVALSETVLNGVLAKDISEQNAKIDNQVLSITDIGAKTNQTLTNALSEMKNPVLPKSIEQSVVNQITEKLNSAVRAGVTEVRLQLRPESLGEVSIRIRIEGDVVIARMQVENQQVKAIVENNFQSLKDALAQHNLQAGSFDVDVQTGSKHGGEAGDNFFGNHSWHGGHPDSSGESENIPESHGPLMTDSGVETGRRFGNNSVEYFG